MQEVFDFLKNAELIIWQLQKATSPMSAHSRH